jgi:hypothetical protein
MSPGLIDETRQTLPSRPSEQIDPGRENGSLVQSDLTFAERLSNTARMGDSIAVDQNYIQPVWMTSGHDGLVQIRQRGLFPEAERRALDVQSAR